MCYVSVKSPVQQAMSALRRLRDTRIRERVQTGNQIHAWLLEFGIALLPGARGLSQAQRLLVEQQAELLPVAWQVLAAQLQHHDRLQQTIAELDRELAVMVHQDDVICRLMAVPGIGVITASKLVADAGNAKGYGSARRFAGAGAAAARDRGTAEAVGHQ